MDWKSLWNKKYALVAFYFFLTAVVYHICIRILDSFPVLGESIHRLFPWGEQVLSPLLLGFAIAYLLSPLCHFFEKILLKSAFFQKRAGIRRNLSIFLSFLLVLLGILLLGSILLSSLSNSVQLLRLDDLFQGIGDFAITVEKFYADLYHRLGDLPLGGEDAKRVIQLLLQRAMAFFQNIGQSAFSSLGNLGAALSTFTFGILFSLYFLADGKKILQYWENVWTVFLGKKRVERLRNFCADADRVFSGYLRGQVIDGLIMAVLVSGTLSILKVRYALMIAVLTGFGNLIPYVGPVVAYGLTALVCVLYGEFTKLPPAVLALFVIQTLDGNVINPRLLSQNIDVHPLVVLISLMIGGSVGGFLGIFLAAPIASLIKMELDRFVQEKKAEKKEMPCDNDIS